MMGDSKKAVVVGPLSLADLKKGKDVPGDSGEQHIAPSLDREIGGRSRHAV